MSKRRTKAQKLRANLRRERQQLVTEVKTEVKQAVAAMPSALKPTPAVAQASNSATKTYRQIDLGRSLWLLGFLVVVQLGLWLVLHFTHLDSKLYNWIKV